MDLTLARRRFCVIGCLAAALVAGCKSGVERDVVQRQMRQQEDQIYALEDYLSEYQQLLCDARNENAMLKRQMVQGQFRETSSGGRAESVNTLPSPSATPTTAPAPAEPEVDTNVTPPEVPPLDLETPSVPPLEDQSANEPERVAQEIQPAAAEIEVVSDPATDVVLRGEVVLEDSQAGPRVLLEVEPMTDAGKRADFFGRMSLLVLDPAARAKEQQLARWDFTPEELDAMAIPSASGTAYEFPLQLPADAPTDRPLELWVRLNPEDGEKVLGRTTMDVSRAGRFASAEVKPVEKKPRRPVVQTASAEMPVQPRRVASRNRPHPSDDENGWRIAKPGDVAKPQAAKRAESEWKLATRPVPEVESTPIVASRPIENASDGGDRYSVATAPDWSPERPADDSGESPAEPTWSPTR
jgi:hypothetical protein